MKTIVWRPGTPTSSIRPTTAQQGRPFTSAGVGTGVQLDGELIASVPDTLVLAEAGDVTRQIYAWGGDCKVIVDTLLAPAVLPAGQVWPGFGVDPTSGAANPRGPALLHIEGGRYGALTTILRVTDTAQVLGVASLKDVTLDCDALTTQAVGIGSSLDMERAVIRNRAGAAVPCIKTPDNFSGLCRTDNRASFDNSASAVPILQLGTTGADPGSVLSMTCTMGLSVGANPNAITASNPGTVGVVFFHDASIAVGYLAAQCPAIAAGITDVVV